MTNDPRLRAFNVLLQRRRHIDQSLRETLATQRAEHSELLSQVEARQAQLDAQTAELDNYDARLATMQESKAPVNLLLFNHCQEYRGVVAERQQNAEQEFKQAQTAVQQKEDEMAETRRKIVKNEGQIDVYEARIRTLMQAAEQASDEAQDEEVAENQSARMLRARRAKTEADTAA